MKMALIVLGAAVGGPMRFVIDQKFANTLRNRMESLQ
jgi:fluoride ion exporter CrcB/FEX